MSHFKLVADFLKTIGFKISIFEDIEISLTAGKKGEMDINVLELCITASGHLCPISNHKNLEIARYSINFCDLRSNKSDPNLCAYLWKLIRPRSLRKKYMPTIL